MNPRWGKNTVSCIEFVERKDATSTRPVAPFVFYMAEFDNVHFQVVKMPLKHEVYVKHMEVDNGAKRLDAINPPF